MSKVVIISTGGTIAMQHDSVTGAAVPAVSGADLVRAIPGLGSYVLSAIQHRDYPVIQGYVLITGTTFVLVTLAIDLLYILVNPKIRVQGGEA